MTLPNLTVEQICRMFGCSKERLKEQYTANLAQLKECHASAIEASKAGKKKYRGATVEDWAGRIKVFEDRIKECDQ